MKRPRAAGIMARAGAVPFWGLLGAVLAIPLLAGPAGAQQPPPQAVRQIEALLAAKAQRTPAQRKVSSQLLEAQRTPPQRTVNSQLLDEQRTPTQQKLNSQLQDALRAPLQKPTVAGTSRLQATDPDAKNERVMVDIRTDVTPTVLKRIRDLGGTVISSVPKYRAIRAQLPLAAVGRLAALAAVQTIRPADEAVTRKDNTTQGDGAHRANAARTTYGVDGTGIGIGVISDGVRTLADRQASGDVSARVTVLPGQAGARDEGTALLEILHDLAPGAELYFATGLGGQARMAVNIEALCEAGANVIFDDIGYLHEAAFQDDIVAQGVNAAVADGCVFFSAGGNDGNLTNGTSGVWEGDYAAGSALEVDGRRVGTKHDFGGGVEANELRGRSVRTIILQWADPLGASTNDYDLFLVNENGDVIASSTDTQDGTQDPIESISSPIFDYSGLRVVVVKASGADRYLRVQAHSGPLAIATAGTLYGHSAQENAISVAMVDVATAGGSGGVFDGTESVRSGNSDGPRRIFFQPDGTAITAGNFSATGGKLLQKPDLTAATCVATATPGFSRFCGTSAAAPHAAAIGALMLEAAGGPDQVTLAQLRTAMTGAALDIEAAGVDRDSGAGIVMAPGAVDAVDVAVADRNGAPTVTSSQSNRTFAAGAAAVTIDLANVFEDPDNDTLTYTAVSSDPDRLAITRSGSVVTLTPGSPGRAVVTLRASDPHGLSAVETFSVTVTAGNRDYDADNDGFIDVANLAQLDAVRYDLNGDGLVDGATWMPYYDAFPMGARGMGCPSAGCTGYELTANLDFDTNSSGDADVGDTYWNAGAGWAPIGEAGDPFTADFEGEGYTVANLFIDRDTEDGVGLFGEIGGRDTSVIRGVGLVGVDVTGSDGVGSLLGHGVYATVIDSYATGRVSGQDEVGGLVGRTWGRVLRSYAAVNVSGADAVGGLVGHQILNDLDSSYATGNVEGTDAVGGLVGAVSDTFQTIVASYATGDVSGGGARLSESDSGFIICDSLSSFTTSGPVETATNSGGGVGGLVGSSCGVIRVSYATGEVSGDVAVGGLIGSGYVRVQSSYWDLETSGVRVGVGEDDENDNGVIDGTESQRLGVGGKTTAELQTPTDYTGIYAAWNVDLDGSSFSSGEVDDPWDFGTSTQYPVLSLDLNDDNRATWQEFGYQVRSSLTLTAATTASQAQVVLSWTAISTSSWSPAPDVSYTLYRDDGTTIEAIETNLTGLTHTDTDVTINGRYTYWVAVVVDGGEAVRSAPVSVTAGVGNQPPVAVGIVADRALEVGATALVVDVAGAFLDPDDDALTYAATSSRTSVATLSRSGSMLTITPGSAGRTTITVTATDAGGSNMGATQRFAVRVGYNYDADGDRLIGISNLAQFDAMHYDLNGNGLVTGDDAAAYAAAFPDAFDRLGCGIDGCAGYELLAALDFDTDGDGSADAGDTYWNGGAGWEPIGVPSGRFFGTVLGAFNATFDGNGHSIANLFVARDDHSGLFGAIGSRGAVRDVRLTDMDVTGNQGVGGLAGENLGVVSRVQSAGQVLGEVQVGGLVGANLGTITLSRSSAAVTGMAPPDFVRTSDLDRGTGGLVGYNGGAIRGSYAIGRVVGDSNVGGLVGWNFNDGFVGSIRRHASIVGSYATGSVAGRSSVGGLVGTNGIPGNAPFVLGEIHSSYATGRVSGPSRGVGGLVGYDSGDDSTIITASYWDTNTSGQTSGSFGIGKTTAQLKAPTGYSGIYRSWNVDVDDDGTNDAWHFGTGRQYPVLKANVDGQGAATWQEFGYQLRSGPTLMTPTVMPTMTAGQAQVNLTWTAVDASHWAPEPDVTYTVTRADGDTLETLAEDLGVLLYTDSAARTGAAITYQVVAVVDGGEPVRSAAVVVNTPGNSPPLPVGTLSDRWLHAGDEAGVEVGAAFQDPENDTLTYTAASSATGVVMVSVSGSRVTITPVATGTATITVTATDAGGSMASGTQTFTVTVRPSSATDYDADDDGLIEITELEQLDAIRHDLNGDGVPTTDGATAYAAAFSTVGDRQACGGLTGCVGYELADNLDFDTNSNGSADSGDTYWNAGAGWEPIDADTSSSTPGVIVFRAGFRAIFEGNGHTIANLFIDRDSDDVGLFGRTSYGSVIRHVGLIDVEVSGSSDVGGLAGTDNNSSIIGSYVTGMVSGTGDNVGGLVGQTYGSSVVTSYAAVEVTGGNNVGGLIGENDTAVTASYATGWVAGDDNVGGLVGSNGITITASYATGPVTGQSNVGGLVGRNTRSFSSTGTVTASYWDTSTSGQTTGSGRTTAQLQAPTSYSGIYQRWNVDLDGDGVSDNPWDFGTADQYPALKTNFDGQGTASWQEFGRQLRKGPTLTTTVGAAQVVLTWTPVDASVWTPPPEVTYTLYRDNGTAVETVAADLDGRQHTDTGVITGVTYTYQVAAVVQGGEAVRSARVSVRAVMPTTSVVVLKLMPDSIGENGGVSTVTASLDRMSSAVTTVTVSAAAVHPTLSKDFMLSTNQTLTIPAGQLDSTGTVTVQAVNNNVYDPNKTVTVSAMATNMRGVTTTPAVTLAIRDDDPAPELTLEVGPSAIVEAAGNSTVTVRITNGVTFAEDQKIALAFAGTAAKGTDYTVGLEMLTLTAGQISAVTTVTATDDRVDDDNETILLTASHGGGTVGAEQTITITDDDASPVITTASLILVVENETAVATLAAADADLPAEDLTWRITGGGDRNKFRLTADGVLTFAAAPDYEEPDDSDGDGDYEVAVQVTDGFNPVEAVFTVRLQDVDDTAPVLSSTVVNGATLTLTYGEMLDGSSTPLASAFTVTGGDTSRTVTAVFLNGSAVLLTVDPAVEHGETGIRVSYTVPTGTGTSPLQDVLGNDVDRLSNVPVSNETPDTTSPTVRRLAITSDPGTDRTYAVDDEIQVTVTFSETVEVTGTPQLSLELGGGRRTADYEGGSGTAALVFAYKVADGESDTDGMGIEPDSLSGGTIRDEARNNAELDHDGLAADSGHKVDAVKPQLAATGGVVVDGATLTLTYGELLDGSSTLAASDFTVSGGDLARTVSNAAVSGSAVALTLDPAVEHGETGVTVSYTPGTNPIRDVAGNEAEALSRVPVNNETPDTTAPGVISLAISSNPGSDQAYAAEDVIEVTVTFSETVEVTGTPQLRLRVGSSNRTADYLRGTDTEELGFAYEVADGDEDTGGVSIEAGRITLNGGTIEDEADNPAELAHEAVAAQAGHKVDGVRPVFVSAAVDGSSLTLTYGETLDGGSRPAPGDFTVEVDGAGRSVTGVSVSGSVVTLTLSTAVEHGDTGIRVSYTPGTNPIQDAVGNDARGLSNQAVTNTTGAPNTAPEITTVGPFTVPENQALVRRLAARDDDSGDEVTGWSIMGGADQSQFSITSDTGVLSFQEAPDYESPTDVVSGDPPSGAGDNEYVVTVEVRSGAGARELEAEQTFTVRVTDEQEPPGIPEAPAFSGETSDSLTVHWRDPENTGPAITDYDVRYREKGPGRFIDAQHMGPGLSLTLDDLEPGTAYEVQVRATNDEGASDWSESGEGMTVTPLTVEMMGGTEPPVEGPFTVRFSFSEPVRGFTQAAIETAQDPACTDEQNNPVFCEPDIGRLETVDDRVFNTTVTPQTDRVAHNYTLTLTVSGGAVRSSVGNKLNEEAMLGGRVAPPGVTLPISEIGLRASGLDRAGRLNWNRPTNDGGSPIIRYEHRHAPVGEVWNDWENVGAGAVGVTVGNLVNGLEYVFEVRAVNALGKGPVETAAATPVLRTGPPPPPPPPPGPRKTVPDAPTNLLADGGNEQVALSWEAPEDDGGFAITDYEVRINGRGSWISTGSIHTTHTVTGLTNGTAYVFQVRAVNAAGSSPYSNRAEATPGVGALDFAHFANGAGIISDLVFVNVATHPIRPVLYFYDKEGNLIDPESMVDLTGDLEVTGDGALSIWTEMEPLGELTISTHGRGELVSGSVKVAANGPIGGVLRFDLPGIGVAGVGASQPVRDALFPARRQAGGISTAAAIHNIEEEAIVVSCHLMNGGVVLEEMEISLAAYGQEAQFIEEMFTTTDTSNFVGLVRCTGPGRFTGVAVELDAASRIFTTLPVVPVNLRGRGREAVLDFAHFANGEGITSDLVFVNVETQPSGPAPTPYQVAIPPIRPALYFYDKEGNPIAAESVVEITGDLEVRADGGLSVRTEMEPLGELTISTHGQGEVVSGSVRVVSDGPIGGVLRFDLPGIGVAGVGASQPVRDALFPARREGDLSTAAAIRNLGEEAMEVSCQLMSGGIVLEEAEIPLEANGQEARFIEEVFPRTDTSDFVGSVRCTAPPGEGMFTGVAVELDAGNRIFTTLPVVPVPRAADSQE